MTQAQGSMGTSGRPYCISCVRTPAGVLPYAVTQRDVQIDALWARRQVLAEMGVARGSLVHFTHTYSEEIQFWPYYVATLLMGGTVSNGMPSTFDSYRMEMYMRRLRFQVVFGIAPGTLDGLEQAGHVLSRVFAHVPHLVALPGAYERLVRADLAPPWRAFSLGPCLAVEAPDRSGARYDVGEWDLESRNGRIFLSAAPRRRRDCGFVDLDTGVDGEIGLVKTPHGREPRIFLAVGSP